MKVNEYLSSKNAAGELLEKKYKRASKRFPLTTILFVILIAGMLIGATRFLNSSEGIVSEDSFVAYERSNFGNAVVNTLNNGIVADNQYGYTDDTDKGIKVVGKNGECVIPKDSSNINITDKGVYYRNNANKTYCFMDYSEKKEKVVLNEPCGNCIVSNNERLYLIRFSKDSYVYSFDLNGKNEAVFIGEPVRAFTLLEDAVFYLNYNNELVKLDENGNEEYSLKNVDKFYLNGDLFIQNNDKVIRTTLSNENGEIVAEGVDELLGVTDQNIYYSKGDKVYERQIEGSNEKVFSQGSNYYEGVYKKNGKVVAVGENL